MSRSSLRRIAPLLGLLSALASPVARAGGERDAVSFNRDIRPLLADRCFACHGPDAGSREADLRLDQNAAALTRVIVPGDAAASELFGRLNSADLDERMPPASSKKAPLNAAQIGLVERWIEEGARYEPHWSLSTLRRPMAPDASSLPTALATWPRGAIDRFLSAGYRKAGLTPAPEADRVTLVRRLYLDVIGLPPTPVEVDRFLHDNRPDAYEQLVDELLASPRYGERMASWWFDLVRFANTVGYHGDQEHHITPYRDYVIRAFNENLAFDQFTVEQLAGDLLESPTLWQRVATGYNRVLQTSHEGGIQDGEYRAKMLADRVRNFSEVWIGSSMGCAECHDHKFDPFTQQDFYDMEAFFADVDWHGSFVGAAKNDETTSRPPEMLAWTLPVAEQAATLDVKIGELEMQLTGALPDDYQTVQGRLLALKKERVDLEAQFIPTMITVAAEPREIRVLPRGNWMDRSGPLAAPRTPAHLPPLEPTSARPTRLDLARWVMRPDHPLASRVLVNRLWKLYFGAGLSKNLIELGSQGDWPSHPELLDWLAVEMIESGWNVKHVVRLITTSSAYRQSSDVSEKQQARDPENRWLARQGRYRLEAEQIRDLALAASGLMVHRLGGETIRPYQPVGYYAALNFPQRKYTASEGEGQFRRAVYVHWQRQFLHPWLIAFDAPTREECTAQRAVSNTPSAALVMLNDPTFVEAARALALETLNTVGAEDENVLQVVQAQGAHAAGHDAAVDSSRIASAWRQVQSRRPTPVEIAELRELLAAARSEFAAHPQRADELLGVGISGAGDPRQAVEIAAWTSVCRALLNLDETITRN